MGAKHLKAIAIRGKGEIPVADANKLKPIALECINRLRHIALRARNCGSRLQFIKDAVGIAAKNWQQTTSPVW